ncbi:DUF927 domain-containing protein [Methylohalobius crimeensis]|uniref:DUF927 domain-containing protein n=1 Tax=Methylohalobius crimeensis TaxID=244365 RepID=UPI0003B59C04|nr:DUF927 domain-containing protein [Methylohalobius crimeensis]
MTNDLDEKERLDELARKRLEKAQGRKKSAMRKTKYPSPDGWQCTDRGVAYSVEGKDDKTEWVKIAHKPVWVDALSRDGKKESWGRLVVWLDHDNHRHEMAMSANLLHSSGNEMAQLLSVGGLPIVPGKERKLLQYLASFATKKRLTSATVTGWNGRAFVLPSGTINNPVGEKIIYQPPDIQTAADAFGSKGSIDEWQAALKNASALIVFSVSASLAAPMRFITGIEAGGFHFHGQTSHGKTTLLQAAASVWGDGSDPQMAGGSTAYIQRWNATDNALEATAECFNDLPLCVDEIGESDTKDFGRTIYRIMAGTGRKRSTTSGGLRKSKSWRVMVLSAGELAASEYAEEGGKKVRGGQRVRLADIPIDQVTLFRDADEADTIKHICASHFGHVGPLFIEHGTQMMLNHWKAFEESMVGEARTPEAGRVRKRFALAACAGELAIRIGLLPWNEGDALNAARFAYEVWRGSQSSSTDAERGIVAIQDFILKNDSRFERLDGDIPRDRAGWVRDGFYHFTPESFKEALNGANQNAALKELMEMRLLHRQGREYKSRIRVNGERIPVFSIKSSILSPDSPDGTDRQEYMRGSGRPDNETASPDSPDSDAGEINRPDMSGL